MKTVRDFRNSSWTWHLLVLHRVLVSVAHTKNTSCRLTNLTSSVTKYLFSAPLSLLCFFQSSHLSEGFCHFASKGSIQQGFKTTIQLSWYSTILHRTSPMDHVFTIFLWFMIQKIKIQFFTKLILYHPWNLRLHWKTLSWNNFVKTMMDRLHGQERLYTLMLKELTPTKHMLYLK